jgi:hypothetical protein
MVQGWFPESRCQDRVETYEPLTCLVCTRLHLVNPKTGKVVGGGPFRRCSLKHPSFSRRRAMARKLFSIILMWLAVEAISTAAFAFSKHTDAVTDASVRRLLRLMDKDKNGTVSKNEFMNYFSRTFDRLDVDHNRRLVPDELRPMLIPNWAIRPKSSKDQM